MPSADAIVLRRALVSSRLAVIVAPGTTALEESRIVPEICAVCARIGRAKKNAAMSLTLLLLDAANRSGLNYNKIHTLSWHQHEGPLQERATENRELTGLPEITLPDSL